MATSARTGSRSPLPIDLLSSLVCAWVSRLPISVRDSSLIMSLRSPVGAVLLGLLILAVTRYIRIRRRRASAALVPERPPTAMAQRGYITHRHTRSMASTTASEHHRQKSYAEHSRSNSISTGHTPAPSPLRNAQYTRPQSGYEIEPMEYQQPMQNDAYAPISSAGSGDIFADHHLPYDGVPRQYSQREMEEVEYLKDASRRGSKLDFGFHKV